MGATKVAGVFTIIVLFVTSASHVWATHAALGSGIGHGGPITTVSAPTMQKGKFAVELMSEYQKFDTFSDGELSEFTERGEEDIHNVDSLLNTFLGVAYGIADDLTFHVRIPYVYRNNISEIHHEESDDHEGGHEEDSEIERLGDAKGFGDLSMLFHYRYLNKPNIGFQSAIMLGLKLPTGETSIKGDNGETLEAEFQPGSGSWDPMAGVAITKRIGRLSLDASLLYTLVNEGTQDTDLGDALQYNAALSYKALKQKVILDLILELNGAWRDKEKANGDKDPNSGGNIIFLTPGVRISTSQRWNAFLSVGLPVIQDLNGIQNEVDSRTVFGINIHL